MTMVRNNSSSILSGKPVFPTIDSLSVAAPIFANGSVHITFSERDFTFKMDDLDDHFNGLMGRKLVKLC